ncbi:MAG: acetolactate synthase, large subunit, biosynthetic type [Zetaproteobacteria bacterium CG06_land_8_20_14_3_00_59_53]|nr:MAG: acetolactate synthase, large subunit, biosynthetic type [Zetaproteobacteria bacterium CG2_30_59_37]PIO89575.1 MAG: acetolactate synthase, large subunit, biosynthetic type [Zetaproteobacteria bacterium CG23_combo_of_CG06-09_8_20_14_all_59_86]PIQ65808.1 MAG: acetolactate synthase, large subunit, biosynthetic type [Zetaproteobacteria bacterium CG11_big_fil_rev_8_21_14_0_20_59_439]PIU70959.1 MAG: acetolactate synthase, large subunit, biosynthetic type [Zetaproteobacteria bacterium CG06_land_
MKMTGAEILVECLKRENVDTIFGYPGGAVLHIYDAIFKQDAIKHYLVRHEQAALHSANGYARVSGKCGVALVTSGPGATNAVTGLADSLADSIPTVCISGQVPSSLIGNDAFQEADVVGITRSATKHNFLVKRVEDIALIVRQAFHIATTGRPGPVLIDIPKDISGESCEFIWPEKVEMRSYKPVTHGHPGQIKRAVKSMLSAKRPVLYTGGGILNSVGSAAMLRELSHALNAPVTNTLMGLGGMPHDDPHFLGMLGMHGTFEANMAVSHCDLLVAIGARFDDRVTGRLDAFAPDAKVIHIDIDPSSISKNIHAHLPIVGDVGEVLKQLLEEIARRDGKPNEAALTLWWEQINQWRSRDSLGFVQDADGPIKPQTVVRMVHEKTRGNAIVATDVGQHQMWAAQFYGFNRPHRWLTSGGLGTMGYGLPAGIGAQVAMPEEKVIVFTGDSSIQMCSQEFSTAFQYNLPVIVIILNNGYMGMVRQWQEMFYESRYSQSYFDSLPDFVKMAETYGGTGIRVDSLEELSPALDKALASHDQFIILDVAVSKEENVFPMVPAGAALNEMVLS